MKRWNELASSISGFIAAGIFDRHGTLLSGLSQDEDFHIEHAAATYVTLINEADRAGNFTGLGESAEVQLIYKDAIILLRAIDGSEGRLVLGLASRNDAPLGRIRVGMDLIIRKIVEPSKARLSRERAKTQEIMHTKTQEIMPAKTQEIMPAKTQEIMPAKTQEIMPAKTQETGHPESTASKRGNTLASSPADTPESKRADTEELARAHAPKFVAVEKSDRTDRNSGSFRTLR